MSDFVPTGKRILMLGGSLFQVPAIQYAKAAGHYVITCDYLPDNPGHRLADEYYNVSTTDLDAVLQLAERLHIDAIVAYASEPSALTAAYVGNRLGLPSNPYESVKTLSNKDLYRQFLRANGFHAPRAAGFDQNQRQGAADFFAACGRPVVVKPVDSSGSKGVTKVSRSGDLDAAADYALGFSRAKRFLVEEFVERVGPQIHGDGFVIRGQLVHACLGDHRFAGKIVPFVPVSTTFPTRAAERIVDKAREEIQRILRLLRYQSGPLNLEIMVDRDEHVYIMEIGPRNGGNFVPQLVKYSSGVDAVALTVQAALGELDGETPSGAAASRFCAYYVVHADTDGVLARIGIAEALRANILERHDLKVPGQRIEAFNGANCAIALLLLHFGSREEMQEKVENMDKFVTVEVRP